MCGVLTLTRTVRVIEPLLLRQLEITDSWLVAVNRPAEAAAAFVVEILSRRASLSQATAGARTGVPVLSRGARLGFAPALAKLVVPIFIFSAAFILMALTVAGLSVEEKLRGADLDVAFALAIVEVEELSMVAG